MTKALRVALLLVLATGCTLYERKGGSGGDDDGPGGSGSGGGGGGPVGRTFFVERTTSSSSPCPIFDGETLAHQVSVNDLFDVNVDGRLAIDVSVRDQPAFEANGEPPNVVFTIDEQWSSPNGPAFPFIRYEMWVDTSFATGKASTEFPFESTSCSYTWVLNVI